MEDASKLFLNGRIDPRVQFRVELVLGRTFRLQAGESLKCRKKKNTA